LLSKFFKLALDLSTKSTGWALFDIKKKALINYGVIKPKVKGLKGIGYPEGQLLKMRSLVDQLTNLILVTTFNKVTHIIIEEINRGKNRLGQKVLDGFHFILIDRLYTMGMLNKVTFKDSDGKTGWRGDLGLYLSEDDKRRNKKARAYNKTLPKRAKTKLMVINQKHLACKYVNKKYKLKLNVNKRASDADICDAIGLGSSVLWKFFKENNG